MNLDSQPVARARVSPHYGVVPDDAAGRMIERSHHRKTRALAHIHRRYELANLVGIDDAAVDAEHLVVFRTPAQASKRGVGVCERQVTALAEKQVPLQLS